jgi:hypothetical protein
MRWSDDGLEATVALRLGILNGDLAAHAAAWPGQSHFNSPVL